MGLAKLDGYDYILLPGVIRINVSGTNDPDLVDIMSEVERSDGNIYVEGRYYRYLNNYGIFSNRASNPYLELHVVEIA